MARLLDGIEYPRDVRKLTLNELPQLATEIREEVISVVSEVGGHLASTLGAVELTLALHYVFKTPEDRIVWDTGHQAYAHKLICGRRKRLATIRQLGGVSGFLSREESEYDVFGAGHAGTSISAALGMVEAKTLEGSWRKVVAVISDGGLSAGLTFEGLNQAGHLDKDLIVVLNDNEHFIDPRVGAVSSFLSKQFTTDLGVRLQKNLSTLLHNLPSGENLKYAARKFRDSFLGLVTPGFLFESLGFQYVGPIDGHNIAEMVTTGKRQEDRRTHSHSRPDEKRQRLRAGRKRPGQISQRDCVSRAHRQAKEGKERHPELHGCICPRPYSLGKRKSEGDRHHRRHGKRNRNR